MLPYHTTHPIRGRSRQLNRNFTDIYIHCSYNVREGRKYRRIWTEIAVRMGCRKVERTACIYHP